MKIQDSFGTIIKLMLFCLYIGILYSCTTGKPDKSVLKISSQKDLAVTITTFSDFESDIYHTSEISSGATIELPINYSGFALLSIDAQRSYPLILGHENVFINLGDGQSGPEIIEGDENFPVASAILQSMQLLESSGHIKTIGDLHERQKEISRFAADNYAHLAHSD